MNSEGVGFPDWDNVQVLLQNNREGNGTISQNGWLTVSVYGTSQEISINGALQDQQVFLINGDKAFFGVGQEENATAGNSFSIPVKQGDTWSTATPARGTIRSYVVKFYPFLNI